MDSRLRGNDDRDAMKRHIPAQAGIQGDMRIASVWLALDPRLRGGTVGGNVELQVRRSRKKRDPGSSPG
ncbi:hypothetical protein AVT10_10825 [Sphingomonas hankookensis]|uniref:Uncharacterized protein n=1 Tax=Sphingomonas hankookensis TaxID=563996 RepID=A0ABR5YF56_9SPHN|nr:hypothetical protein AVT10_10825 [Sphingomonas hankookensis]PZT95928.1 MAG: hypothetical protein DI625_04230 [Sphingomonas sp.]RSV22574.1 hypothetical protein CA237_15130 [Sphingomonas sp. ABOLH]RSV22575.1 hypothetical protein CA237_15135 [Sphingomonas sp. ABOLH]RSV22576.1 hypothetical protein CA237_15140 [Sphingomonas sp. ABOLH]